MVVRSLTTVGCAVAMLLLAVACGSCREPSADGEDDAGCTYSSCDQECRERGLCYGSCGGGRCNCTDDGCGTDIARDDAADMFDEGTRRESEDGDASDEDAEDDIPSVCEWALGPRTRDGAATGVSCRQVPAPSGRVFSPATGEEGLVVFSASTTAETGEPMLVVWYDWSSGNCGVFEDLDRLPCETVRLAWYPSLARPWLAYGVDCSQDPGGVTNHNELRLFNIETGERRMLARNQAPVGEPSTIAHVALDYPWVVWRDVSETWSYAWLGYAMNIETGEQFELSPPAESDVMTLGVLDGIAMVEEAKITVVDLESGARRLIVGLSCLDDPPAPRCDGRWDGVITPNWIAWLDSRAHPECGWFNPCSTQIYGWNRSTETEQPLVTSPGMHGPRLTGHGDWLVYEDQRDDPDPEHDWDRQQNIYGLFLPTMTEIRIEDWPGFQYEPAVYDGTDGYHVLFFEETSAGARTSDLWDCTLPASPG